MSGMTPFRILFSTLLLVTIACTSDSESPTLTATPQPTQTVASPQAGPTAMPPSTPSPPAPAPTRLPSGSILLDAPDLIFFNGNVITMESAMPTAESVAVLGEKILFAGTDQETLAVAGPETRLIDLGGRTLLPGFVDPHNHVFKPPFADAERRMLEAGTTTFGRPGVREDQLLEIMAFEESDGLRARASIYLSYNTACGEQTLPENWYFDYPAITDPEAMLRIPGVKIFTDGGSCNTLAVSYPRDNPGGDLYMTSDELTAIVGELQAAGYQAAIHALGDCAVDTALTALKAYSPFTSTGRASNTTGLSGPNS